MVNLLNQYSISEIIFFIVFLALALKEVANFFEWLKSWVKGIVTKQEQPEKIEDKIIRLEKDYSDQINELKVTDQEIKNQMSDLTDKIQLLINSDKAAILGWITQQYYKFTEQGYIDDFSLMSIEKRFTYYQEEKGNSFAEDLVKELRALPKSIDKKK